MEKKYQVFVSSTYKDLLDERREVMQALLELDCIPVGMELFPAADDDQWTLIKRLIDDCDYYILIVGGRYGSLSVEGISYTQMEYEYALSQEIPIISFLPKNPDNIPIGKSDGEPEKAEKLAKFKEFAQKKLCRYWETPSDLGSMVSRSLVRLIKDKPRPGWVRANQLMSEDATKEILELRRQIDAYEIEVRKIKDDAPADTSNLSQGIDLFELEYTVVTKRVSNQFDWNDDALHLEFRQNTFLSWNEIFYAISPILIDEASESEIANKLDSLVWHICASDIDALVEKIAYNVFSVSVVDTYYQTIKIQLRALGLIVKSDKKKSIHAKGSYWTLTPYGDTIMMRLRAIKKPK
ncbi:MAG: DUF4062 domain-containing protein [Spirosoma sp.]|nr:DUF4062 domain-containing protein [Spirosoma sp.]